MTTIDRDKLAKLHAREEQRFLAEHPKSAALYQRAQSSLLGGVPMNWMKKWAGPFPVFVQSAKGAHFVDVDGREYIDLCLGDTGAMTGHSPEAVTEAVARQSRQGLTLMLPTEDAIWVGEDLQRRFPTAEIVDCKGRIVMPGMVNTHSVRKYWSFITATTEPSMRLSLRCMTEWSGRDGETSDRR